MSDNDNDLVLYLLPRKDMDSLNHTGKVIAQGAHAANHAIFAIGKGYHGTKAMTDLAQWEKQTSQGFGTTIVLGSVVRRVSWREGEIGYCPLSIRDIGSITQSAIHLGFAAGMTQDPSYPLTDGKAMHSFPCETCGWIFGSKSSLAGLLSNFHLHSADPASV